MILEQFLEEFRNRRAYIEVSDLFQKASVYRILYNDFGFELSPPALEYMRGKMSALGGNCVHVLESGMVDAGPIDLVFGQIACSITEFFRMLDNESVLEDTGLTPIGDQMEGLF